MASQSEDGTFLHLDAAFMATDSHRASQYCSHTLPFLTDVQDVQIDADRHSGQREDIRLFRICSRICEAVQGLPSVKKLSFQWGCTSLASLQEFRSLLPQCEEIALSFVLKEGQGRLYETAAMHFILRGCANVQKLHFNDVSGFIKDSEDIHKLASTLCGYCPRLKSLGFTNHDWLDEMAASNSMLSLVTMCQSLVTLDIESDVYSSEIAVQLAKRRMRCGDLIQHRIPASLWATVLEKQIGGTEQDRKANLTVIFQFLQRTNLDAFH